MERSSSSSSSSFSSSSDAPDRQQKQQKHHHNKVNDFTSSKSSNQTKKRSRHDFEGEEEEDESTKSSSSSSSSLSSSSSSSSDASARQKKRTRTPPTLCKIKGDVLLYLMKFILVDDLKNIVSVNKLFKGIVRSYLQLLLKQPSFSTTDDFWNLNRAFEMLEVLSNVPNYDPKKIVILKQQDSGNRCIKHL